MIIWTTTAHGQGAATTSTPPVYEAQATRPSSEAAARFRKLSISAVLSYWAFRSFAGKFAITTAHVARRLVRSITRHAH
jgi:hypothetical protein